MNKKFLGLLLTVVAGAGLIAGCNQDIQKTPTDPNNPQQTQPEDKTPQKVERLITYNLGGGQGVTDLYIRAKQGDTITLQKAPTKKGYRFLYWDVEGTHYNPYQTFTMVDKDFTINAVWAQIFSVTIDFNQGVGSSVNYGEVISGDVITLPAQPSRTDYTFDGWSDGKQLYPANSKYTIKGNVTFTAQFTSRLSTDSNVSAINSSLTLNKMDINNEKLTVHDHYDTIYNQLDLQMDAFASSLLTRLATIWGWGLDYGGAAPTNMDYITEKFVYNKDTPNSLTPTEDFYNGVIKTRNREIVPYEYSDYYDIVSPAHIGGNYCTRVHSDINCPGCYELNLTTGYWLGVNDLGAQINLRDAIIGGDSDKYKSEPWEWTTHRAGANLITIREFLDLYHTAAKQAIANIIAYGEDKEIDYETALNDITHLGFTDQDKDNIIDFVLNTVIGTDVVNQDNARKPSVTEVTRETVFNAEEAKYKAYSLLVPCVVNMTVNEVFYDTQTNQATDTKVWTVQSLYEITSKSVADMQYERSNYMVFKASQDLNIRHLDITFNNMTASQDQVEITIVSGSNKYERTFDISGTENTINLDFNTYANTYFALGKYNGTNETVNTQGSTVEMDNLGTNYILIKLKNGSASVKLDNLVTYK